MPDDYSPPNTMQANIDAVTMGQGYSTANFPTMPAPQVMHPGQISQLVTQQTQGAMNAGAMYARQYTANMQEIQSMQLRNPMFMASGMSGGFNAGMLPSMAQMTPADFGVYRQMALGRQPGSMYGAMYNQPPIFQSLYDQQMSAMEQQGDANLGIPMGLSPYAQGARHALTAGGMYGGYRAMSAFGVPRGIAAGLSMMGGYVGSTMMAKAVPISSANYSRGLEASLHLQNASRNFMIQGGAGVTGPGLSIGGAYDLNESLGHLMQDPSFQRDTGGWFNRKDMTRLISQGSQAGLFDAAQNPVQIKETVKNLAKTLKVFMQVTSEPDVVEAIKNLGQMRTLGFNMSDASIAATSMRNNARLAGTTYGNAIQTAGLPGSYLFQGMGMTGGLGMDVGVGNLAFARQAIAGGAFNTQQLAMLGGVSGLTQRGTEAAAATLRMPMLAASLAQAQGGNIGISGSRILDMMQGRMGIQDMVGAGAANIGDIISKQGIGGVGNFMLRQNELQDSAGRIMGPAGLEMLQMRQIMSMRDMMGLERGPEKGMSGLATAALAMGKDADTVRMMMGKMGSPGFFRGQQMGAERQISEARAEAFAHQERLEGQGWQAFVQGSESLRNLTAWKSKKFATVDAWQKIMSQGASEMGRDEVGGQVIQDTYAHLLPSSPYEVEQMRLAGNNVAGRGGGVGIGPGGAQPLRGMLPKMVIGGRGFGYSSLMADFSAISGGDADVTKALRRAQGGWQGFFGGGSLERAATFTGNVLARWQGMAPIGDEDEKRAELARYGAAGAVIQNATTSTAGQLNAALRKVAGRTKLAPGQVVAYEFEAAAALAKKVSSPGFLTNAGALTDTDIESAIRESLTREGVPPEQIEKLAKDPDFILRVTKQAHDISPDFKAAGWKPINAEELGIKGSQLTRDTLLEGQRELYREVFNVEDTSEGFNSKAQQVLSTLFGARSGGDTGVSALAALYAKPVSEWTDQDRESARYILAQYKTSDERTRASTLAQGLAKSLTPEQRTLAAQFGRGTRGEGGGGQEMLEFSKAWHETYFKQKKVATTLRGVEKMLPGGANPDAAFRVFQETGDAFEAFKRRAADGGTSTDPKIRELLERYAENPNDPGLSKAVQDYVESSVDSGTRTVGGISGGGAEAGATNTAAGWQDLAASLGKDFPRATTELSAASQKLVDAAQYLRGLRPGTLLNPPTPDSGG